MYLAPWEIDATDAEALRQFADNEIAAGRFLQGAKLRSLIEFWREHQALDHKELLEDNEALGRELRDKLAESLRQLVKLNANIEVVRVQLDGVPANAKGPPALKARVEAAGAFNAALTQVHRQLIEISKQLEGHVTAADEIGTPIEIVKKGRNP